MYSDFKEVLVFPTLDSSIELRHMYLNFYIKYNKPCIYIHERWVVNLDFNGIVIAWWLRLPLKCVSFAGVVVAFRRVYEFIEEYPGVSLIYLDELTGGLNSILHYNYLDCSYEIMRISKSWVEVLPTNLFIYLCTFRCDVRLAHWIRHRSTSAIS